MERGLRRDLHQVAIAFFVFRQHQQMVVCIAVGRSPRNDVVVFLADVELASDDRLDSGFVRGVYEMHGAENIAVIGHGDRGHAEFFDAIDKFLDVASAVEHGVIAMKMQVNELILAHEG